MIKIPFFPFWILNVLLTGCVVGFVLEAEDRRPVTRIFMPAAIDSSIYGGISAPISYALRRILANDVKFPLTDWEHSDWIVEIEVLDKIQYTSRYLDCNGQGQAPVAIAGQSQTCAFLLADGTRPTNAPEEEIQSLKAAVKVIRRQDKQQLLFHKYGPKDIILPTTNYFVVNTDGINESLRYDTNRHLLRYIENVETATQLNADKIAAHIYQALVTLATPTVP